MVKQIMAKQYPEMVFINDLVFNYTEMAVEITEEEYLKMKG